MESLWVRRMRLRINGVGVGLKFNLSLEKLTTLTFSKKGGGKKTELFTVATFA